MKRVLILKIGAIGDIIMALPTITVIKQQYPGCHITWVGGKIITPILRQIPAIDEVIEFDENLLKSTSIALAYNLLVLGKKLAFQRYSLILNFHNDTRYKALIAFARGEKVLNLTRNGERPTLIPGRVRSFEHVRLFLQMDDNYTGCLQFPVDNITADVLTDGPGNVVNSGDKIVILAPGGAKNTINEQILRRWPIDRYVDLATNLLSRGFNVIITGAPSDDWVVPYFAGLSVVNLVGKLNLIQLIALMRKSNFVVTHDSGPYHLAAFAQKPNVICIFGPTNPVEFSYGTDKSKIKLFWGGESLLCSPCYYGKHFSLQCSNNVCMSNTSVEAVKAHIFSVESQELV